MDKPHTVLVVVASRHGSTAEIAARIASQLRARLPEKAWRVQVEDSESIRTIDGYDVVLLGSAIYFGRWLKSARRLLESAGEAPPLGMWLFSSGPVAADAPGSESADTNEDLASRLDIRGSIVFPGCIDTARLSRIERVVTAAMRIGGEDFRDWVSVESWADGIARELAGPAAAAESATPPEER